MNSYTKIFICSFTSVALCSCLNANQGDNIGEDSLTIEDVAVIDENHIDQDKVIANLNFFITKSDFDKNLGKYLTDIKDGRMNRYQIGNYSAMAYPKSFYENDSLYYVEFRGQPYNFEQYDSETLQQYQALLNLYESKYGLPTFKVVTMPSGYSTREGYSQELARWDLGKRTISIRLSEWNGFHCINLVIFRNDIEDRIRNGKEIEDNNRRSAAVSVI